MKDRYEQLTERFHSRSATPDEMQELEALIRQDQALADDFAWQKQVAGAWKHLENRRLKSVLQKEEAGIQEPKRIRFDFRRLSAIAAILVLAIAAIWFFRPSGMPQADDFFSAYPDKLSLGRGAGLTADLQTAMAAYNNGNYQTAASKLGALAEQYPDSIQFLFYQGVALVGNKDYTGAIPVLESVSRQQVFVSYQTNAFWFMAVAETGNKNYPAARRNAEAYLRQPDAVSYRKKAEALLKQLPK